MSAARASDAPATAHAVHIQVSFHTMDESRAQTVARKLIDSAQEIANLPECECDVDVTVQTVPPDGSPAATGMGGAPSRERPPES